MLIFKQIKVRLPIGTIFLNVTATNTFINILEKIYSNSIYIVEPVDIITIEETDEKFIISYNGISYKPSKSYILISIHVLISEIISTNSSKYEFINFHGAALYYNNKTILILGEKGQGKTSFLCNFINKGATYIADESVVYNGIYVIPYENCLHMSDYTIGLLDKSINSIEIDPIYTNNIKKYVPSINLSEIDYEKKYSPDIIILLNDSFQFEKCKYNISLVSNVIKYSRNTNSINIKILMKLLDSTNIYKCNKYSFNNVLLNI